MEGGFGTTLALSVIGHAAVFAGALLAAWLGSHAPRIREANGFAVVLPKGGGGPSAVEPPAAAPAPVTPVTVPPAPAPKPEPPPKVLKPPKEEPRKGLPMPDAKKGKAERTPPPAPASTGGRAAGSGVPGLDIEGPAGIGVPGGDDASGDWYLAGVQRKIWMIWTRQIKSGFTAPITVSLTITETGAVDDVRVVESGGVALLDAAAQRAVYSAAPFTPLPRTYGTNRLTIRAVFRPGA